MLLLDATSSLVSEEDDGAVPAPSEMTPTWEDPAGSAPEPSVLQATGITAKLDGGASTAKAMEAAACSRQVGEEIMNISEE